MISHWMAWFHLSEIGLSGPNLLPSNRAIISIDRAQRLSDYLESPPEWLDD